MKHLLVAIVLCVACKSGEDRAREENAAAAAAAANAAPPKSDTPSAVQPPTTTAPAAPAAAPASPPMPEPTTPAEIDRARNQAMIDGRDKDVLKYCDLGKLDAKSSPQALLGCTLAACRIKDATTAQRYGRPLPKALMDQAKKVCTANTVGL